ncbi:Short-chain dehydrogenase/reductase SDR [Neofusicoccum parvum]|uniref:Short-chain dehydrogenase/reductase SDR n=1 Tax=Neofusicoccum parvum TaxID=310453 RepID=A0ACB5SPA1_9PEZI|nr:Short-chain dehydrogenase/reductase SDR [Neofusicoccum parvum]
MEALSKLPNVTLLPLDVCSQASIEAAVSAVSAQTGGTLDYLINNAGAVYVMPILDSDMQKAKSLFDVNLWGVIAVTQAFAPLVIASQGAIVNISSLAALMYTPYYGIYGASKAALQSFSETLRLELQPFGVKVVTAVSGAVKSKIFTNAPALRLPEDSLYTPAEKEIVARAGGADVEKNHSTLEDYSRTLVSDILGGASGKVYRGSMSSIVKILTAWMPTFLFDWVSTLDTGLEKVGKPKQL